MRFRGDGALKSGEAEGGENRELLIALDGRLAGKSLREIAVDLYGVEAVAAEWNPDGALRSRTLRVLRRARAHAEREGTRDAGG